MKIGFSFGRCVRDIVNGTVQYDDVLFIIASTLFETPAELDGVVEAYMHRSDYLRGLSHDECLKVARRLWDDQKILQPRREGIYRSMTPEHAVWGDIFISPQNPNPSITAAWEQYRMLIQLCSAAEGNAASDWGHRY